MNVNLNRLPRTIAVGMSCNVPEVVLVDQRRLPGELSYVRTSDWRTLIDCVKNMAVRGAPVLGIAGAAVVMLRAFEFLAADAAPPANLACGSAETEDALGCLMCQRRAPVAGVSVTEDSKCADCLDWASDSPCASDALRDAMDAHRTFVLDSADFDPDLMALALEFSAALAEDARPTAVNLSWGVQRALRVADDILEAGGTASEVASSLLGLVEAMIAEDEEVNRHIGRNGADLLREVGRGRPLRLLTHCNAGSLACSYFGTALGVIYTAAEEGLLSCVYADETRPVNQGARLTVWELARAGIPVVLQCDGAAASLIASGAVDAVIVGADRIAANGDTANKIGTLGLAVLASHYGIPFYVAAPESTMDESTATGADIPIEERDGAEVMPDPIEGVAVRNPAFDVTPGSLIDAIVTERGIWRPCNPSS